MKGPQGRIDLQANQRAMFVMPGRWGLATVRGSVLCPVDSKSLVYLGCEVRSLALVVAGWSYC